MAQLAVVIDIPNRKKAALPSFIDVGEEAARLVRKDIGDDAVRFVNAALTDQIMVPQAVTADQLSVSIPGDKTSVRSIAPKRSLISGGAAGNLTVTGIKTTNTLIAVLKIVDANQAFTDLTSEFTITATNTINNTGGTSTASSHVVVVYV
jgi:hypothetical protein